MSSTYRSDTSKRRSAAAQFFMEDDVVRDPNDEEEEEETKTSHQKVVDWINEASITTDVNKKTELLHLTQEIIIHKESDLLDNFLHEVIAFQSDRNAEVRKCVVGFIEEACKKDWDLLPKVIYNLQMLLNDSSPQVQKRVIQACSGVYKGTLNWLAKAKVVTEEMQGVWTVLVAMKHSILDMVDSDNDGIRTFVVKFLETVVLCQTYAESDSLRRENDFTLEDIPLGLKIARRRKLEEEAITMFDLMIKFHGSPHISSVNLMTCMGSLTLIAKMRPNFMGKVIVALETLHSNLPPTLSKSQVSSVRKHLKMQLLNLLRHPSAAAYLANISTLLTDLGATYHEVMKAYPKIDESKRKPKRPLPTTSSSVSSSLSDVSKKPRLDESRFVTEGSGSSLHSASDGNTTSTSVPSSVSTSAASQQVGTETAVDITEQYILQRLTPDFAADLVITAMSRLPDSMPSVFSATYTPIAAAGTQGQIRHVARLLATQLNAAGLGPGAAAAATKRKAEQEPDDDEDDEYDDNSDGRQIKTLVTAGPTQEKPAAGISALPGPVQSSNKSTAKLKSLKLSKITRPLSLEMREMMSVSAVSRILNAEKCAIVGGVVSVRSKMIATMATTFDVTIRQAVRDYILSDVRNNLSLGLAWLYEEYSYMQGFKRLPSVLKPDIKKKDQNYNNLLLSFIETIVSKPDIKEKDILLMRLFLEAPIITDEATDMLKDLCCRDYYALHILQELVIRRPPRQLVYLNAMLIHTAHENPEVRETAIKCVVTLYDRGELRNIIEEYAVLYLSFLRLPQPPDVLFGEERGRPSKGDGSWSEEAAKACLYLYLVLLPINQNLIHELARVYVQTVADVKRIILRLVEVPVRGMGMDSPQLLSLVEECPKGAETLVTRVIHILTDKVAPSAELVARVRELYHTRVSDVRFLIPVLNGLTKKEIIAALPKLMKLNPVVVKEVFNRLLGTDSAHHSSPITPAELLIALHTIDPTKCELKTVMKATSLCFNEKQAYTQEVLAVVMQNLMEITPLPTLLMRTVIQSLSLYPRLIGFVINILQRLILKQVWRQKKVWEGFIKCCQRTKPQSFQVLLQLPAPQLQDVFEYSPDMKQPLLQHVMSFTDNQRAHIPQAVMDILVGPETPIYQQYTVKNEPMSPTELTIDIKEESSEPSAAGASDSATANSAKDSSNNQTSAPPPTKPTPQPSQLSEPAPPGLD